MTMRIGTRDAQNWPEIAVPAGAEVGPSAGVLVVYLPKICSDRSVANLRDNGSVALVLSNPFDHHSVQVKGRVIRLGDAPEESRERVERHMARLAERLAGVGIPPRVTLRSNRWPCWKLELEIDDVFLQTPGPNAGRRLGQDPQAPA